MGLLMLAAAAFLWKYIKPYAAPYLAKAQAYMAMNAVPWLMMHPTIFGLFKRVQPEAPDFRDLTTEQVAKARSVWTSILVAYKAPEDCVIGTVNDVTVPVGSNDTAGSITCRVYTPTTQADKYRCLVFVHGGGWVKGDINGSDALCRTLCYEGDCVVVSVDYRLAPEHPFPVPLQDTFDACRWVAENASKYNIDRQYIYVGGDSAGGNLSAAVCLKAKDEGNLSLRGQVLIYPVTDTKFENNSWLKYGGKGYLLTKPGMECMWRQYLQEPHTLDNPPVLAAPMKATASQLKALPPALVVLAEYDILKDEGVSYASALKSAGVEVKVMEAPTMNHGFINFPAGIPVARDMCHAIGLFLKA
eukprot:GFYU01028471.1.p1 GENE.GFYU01028471.1~~GFYU01028471.1.p1  ORF type:complete len:359 (+),score=111.31 GFYU01028471.1:48-1124(+)